MMSEYESDEGAVCPHCEHLNAAHDSDGHLYDEGLDSYQCDSCDREFQISAKVFWIWETNK